jgi:hypothetical protein
MATDEQPWPITDHDHDPVMRGRWRTARCRCGRRNMEHLSWGRAIAERVGGDPMDYVDRPLP